MPILQPNEGEVGAILAAHVKHGIETCPGHHGFAVRDDPPTTPPAPNVTTQGGSLFGETRKA